MRRIAILLLLLACAGLTAKASAQVRRCTADDGSLVYTDRKCEDIGAVERLPPPAYGAGAHAALRRTTCARSVQDLTYSLSNALYAGDANQVAGLYDWTGMSTSSGYRLMDRLGAIAGRNLVDVQPMYSGGTNEYGYDVAEFDPQTGEVISKPAVQPRLIGLRVEQVLADGHTPSRTVFGLRKRLGCWWLRL